MHLEVKVAANRIEVMTDCGWWKFCIMKSVIMCGPGWLRCVEVGDSSAAVTSLRIELTGGMCAKMSNPDKIKICDEQNTKEMKDLLLSQNMMALDELLESLEDQVYSEVFDSLMYEHWTIYNYNTYISKMLNCSSVYDPLSSIWKMRELAGQDQQSPIPKRTRTR